MEIFDFEKAYDLVLSKIENWASTAVEMLPNFVIATMVVVAFWLIAKLFRKIFKKGISKISESPALIKLMSSIVYVAIIAIGTFVALSVLHLDKAVTSMLAGVGIIGLALGFAFQDIAANFVAGILMATRKPFVIGQLIESQSFKGDVIGMNLRSTRIRTFDGQDVIIPNKEIFQNPLINYTTHPKRRVDIEVGVSYGDDLVSAKELAIGAIKEMKLIDKSIEPALYYSSFGDSSINFSIRFWVDETEEVKYLEAKSKAIMAIKEVFGKNDITIPFPIRTLDFGIKGGEHLKETPIMIHNNGIQSK